MSNIKHGGNAIQFNLPATDGHIYSLQSFSEKKAFVLIFSCNHCPYVIAWEDRLIALGKEYLKKDVGFVLICANDPVKYPVDNFENMQKRAQQKGYPFPYLHDEKQETARAYGAERTPEVFLFDSNGKLAYHGAPDDNYEEPSKVKRHYLRDAINSVLVGKPVEIPHTAPVGCTIKWR